jgi:hypothetical protein
MTYRLLQNGRGVPIALSQVRGNMLELEFQGAPEGANAYIKTKNGAVFYRTPVNGKYSFDLSHIAGEVELGVMTQDAQKKPSRWNCGWITVMHTVNGIVAAPSAADLAEQVRTVMLDYDDLMRKYAELCRKMAELEGKFAEFYEGYDFI